MLFVCREAAGSEQAAGEAGIQQVSSSGVQSCQKPDFIIGRCRMYQALYRKWRPQTFDDVIGQQHITDSLKNQVLTGRLSHAYLFVGTRGTGKTSCARILAKAVNCEHPSDGNPCGECPSCRAIAEGTVMDIVELDAASNNGVDNVRALREEAVFSPSTVRKRVYIVDEVHMLSTSAFNALLKILEEPPEHLMFILATTELQKVPATILSRCQRHSFRRIDPVTLSDYLKKIAEKENISLSPEAADLIAGLAEGGVRDALSMLDQCSGFEKIGTNEVYSTVGLAGNKRTLNLFDAVCRHDAASAIRQFNDLWTEGKDPASLLRELSGLVRDILMIKVAPQNAFDLIYGGYDRTVLKEYAAGYTVSQLSSTLDTLQTALGNMRERLSPKITAELCLVSLSTEIAGDTAEGIRARLDRLEEAVGSRETVILPQPQAVSEKKETADVIPEELPEEGNDSNISSDADEEQKQPEQEKAVIPEEPVQESHEQTSADLWTDIFNRTKPFLPPDITAFLSSPPGIVPEGDILWIEMDRGLGYTRLNRADLLEKFSAAASEVLGKKVKAQMREKKAIVREQRNLDYFRQFPEVRFKQ